MLPRGRKEGDTMTSSLESNLNLPLPSLLLLTLHFFRDLRRRSTIRLRYLLKARLGNGIPIAYIWCATIS